MRRSLFLLLVYCVLTGPTQTYALECGRFLASAKQAKNCARQLLGSSNAIIKTLKEHNEGKHWLPDTSCPEGEQIDASYFYATTKIFRENLKKAKVKSCARDPAHMSRFVCRLTKLPYGCYRNDAWQAQEVTSAKMVLEGIKGSLVTLFPFRWPS